MYFEEALSFRSSVVGKKPQVALGEVQVGYQEVSSLKDRLKIGMSYSGKWWKPSLKCSKMHRHGTQECGLVGRMVLG